MIAATYGAWVACASDLLREHVRGEAHWRRHGSETDAALRVLGMPTWEGWQRGERPAAPTPEQVAEARRILRLAPTPPGEATTATLEARARRAGTLDLPHGASIPGSRYLRSYCSACLVPIRSEHPGARDRCDGCAHTTTRQHDLAQRLRELEADRDLVGAADASGAW